MPILHELKLIVGEIATWALTLMSILVLLLWLKLVFFFFTQMLYFMYTASRVYSVQTKLISLSTLYAHYFAGEI